MTASERRPFGVRVPLGDVLVHALVPAVLVAAYLAPIPYETFLYRPGRSGVVDAYWSTVGHADLAHLLTNLFGYTVLVATTFVLLRRRRRRYYVLFGATMLAVPPLTAGLLELYVRQTSIHPGASPGGAGFSIVTAALLAVLATGIATHQRRTLVRSLPPLVVGLCLFSLAAVVPAIRATGFGALPLLLGGVGVGYLVLETWLLADHAARGRPVVAVALQFSAVVIFVGSAADLFLLENRAWAGHFLGFLGGAVVVVTVSAVWRLRSLIREKR